jgi:hypothetical protein
MSLFRDLLGVWGAVLWVMFWVFVGLLPFWAVMYLAFWAVWR